MADVSIRMKIHMSNFYWLIIKHSLSHNCLSCRWQNFAHSSWVWITDWNWNILWGQFRSLFYFIVTFRLIVHFRIFVIYLYPGEKPLFDFTAADCRFILKNCPRHCGIMTHITPHSFCNAGATFHSATGMTDATFKAKWRWRSNASLSYVRSWWHGD